ncbi:hypothetical protein [Candidatus Thiodictyon syntrophicum]|jgi:hypothetical protein|uniref:Uncharacterized protein n=1 Tax=Candidatus Thiodictyon syntrophicum TaxID=1166950 RepID=A0A2K8U6N5_9GAMM|nr:hypothetical protein [Candidatus Thiodictyon syntrophicum]AUB81246.1 hypothetical protein THSYN_09960 [Candidatus Thiodictyon syntrophicum]
MTSHKPPQRPNAPRLPVALLAAGLLLVIDSAAVEYPEWPKTPVGAWTIDRFLPGAACSGEHCPKDQLTDRPYCFMSQQGPVPGTAPAWVDRQSPPALFITRLKVGDQAAGATPPPVEVWMLSVSAKAFPSAPARIEITAVIDSKGFQQPLQKDPDSGVWYALFSAEDLVEKGKTTPQRFTKADQLKEALKGGNALKLVAKEGTNQGDLTSVSLTGQNSSTQALTQFENCWATLGSAN